MLFGPVAAARESRPIGTTKRFDEDFAESPTWRLGDRHAHHLYCAGAINGAHRMNEQSVLAEAKVVSLRDILVQSAVVDPFSRKLATESTMWPRFARTAGSDLGMFSSSRILTEPRCDQSGLALRARP